MNELLKLSRMLSEEGYEDVLILDPEDARKVLTEKRLEIIETLKNEELNGIRDLSRKLGRNESNVFEDLKVLFEKGVIDFEEEKNRKVPVLSHRNIFIKPINLEEKVEKGRVTA